MKAKGLCPDVTPIYFAKIDIADCFNTIPQDKAFETASQLMKEDRYMLRRFVELVAARNHNKISKRYLTSAQQGNDLTPFEEFATKRVAAKNHIILQDNVYSTVETREGILAVLLEHITGNLVQVC